MSFCLFNQNYKFIIIVLVAALIDAVNIGYDTDTVAAITGAIAGSIVDSYDENIKNLVEIIDDKNDIDIESLANAIVDSINK